MAGAPRGERLGVEFLCEVPLDIAIRETSDDGTPIVVARPDSEHAKAYRLLAERRLAEGRRADEAAGARASSFKRAGMSSGEPTVSGSP